MGLTNFPRGISSMGVPVLNTLGIGNVYFVIKSDEAFYGDFIKHRQTRYYDGTESIHSTIQSALDATVECRNDYVIPYPSNSDYDLTAALTMSKKCVHLVCPAGISYDIGANNACRLDQTTDGEVILEISDSACEVAGFYLKEYYVGGGSETYGHITLAATSYAQHIHHNSFMLKWLTTCAGALVGTGDAGAWGKIERNWFVSQSGGACTCAAVVSIGSSATATQVNHNQITIGDTEIATVGISNQAVKGHTDFNIFSCSGGNGVSDGGTITNAISIHASGCAIGNRGAVGTGELLAGGTADHSFVDNLDAVSYYVSNLEG